MAKKTINYKVLTIILAVLLAIAVGIGAFFIIKGNDSVASPESFEDEDEAEESKLVRDKTYISEKVGTIRIEQEAVKNGQSKVRITLSDTEGTVLDTYEKSICDGKKSTDIGDIWVKIPEKYGYPYILLTGSEMEPYVVTVQHDLKFYGAQIIEWVEDEGLYEYEMFVGKWIEVALPSGEQVKIPRGKSKEYLSGNIGYAGLIADNLIGRGQYTLREVLLPSDWVARQWEIFTLPAYKPYNAFEVCSADTGEVVLKIAAEAYHVNAHVQYVGESQWRTVYLEGGGKIRVE